MYLPASVGIFLAVGTRKRPAGTWQWHVINFETAHRENTGILYLFKSTHWQTRQEGVHIHLGDTVNNRHSVKQNQTVGEIRRRCKKIF